MLRRALLAIVALILLLNAWEASRAFSIGHRSKLFRVRRNATTAFHPLSPQTAGSPPPSPSQTPPPPLLSPPPTPPTTRHVDVADAAEPGGTEVVVASEPQQHELADAAACPGRRPFHTLLTGQGTHYNGWQARIMYYHWQKQKALQGPCGDMGGFTRLCASKGGQPDGLEAHVPSIFVPEMTHAQMMRLGGYGVMNRPWSVVHFFQDPALEARVTEEFVMIAETDHVPMQPLPNLAQGEMAAGFPFGYMHPRASHDQLVHLCWPGGSHKQVDPVGPSPLIVRKAALKALAPRWLNCSATFRNNPRVAGRAGIQDWVLEMWGYAVAAAEAGVRHTLVGNFQIEPMSHRNHSAESFAKDFYIYHYTYGVGFTDGKPVGGMGGADGEWSLEKRRYGLKYPPRHLEPPPAGATIPARWLWRAWRDAIDAAKDWPQTDAMGATGWYRAPLRAEQERTSALIQQVLGTTWTFAGNRPFNFLQGGRLQTPWGSGLWGLTPNNPPPRALPECAAPAECLYASFGSNVHDISFDWPNRKFMSTRLADGEKVPGKRLT